MIVTFEGPYSRYMSSRTATTSAPPTAAPTLKLQRFAWDAPDRLELAGTFTGLEADLAELPVLLAAREELLAAQVRESAEDALAAEQRVSEQLRGDLDVAAAFQAEAQRRMAAAREALQD